MKKVFLLCFLIAILFQGYGQTQRLVLLEEFTSATCGPCVSKNSTFHTWQTQNPDKFTSIYYHVNWPSPGDPMNLANPTEVGTRVNLYMPASSHYVPYSVLDGSYYNGSASGWSMTTVNNRYAMPSPFEINVQHTIAPGQDSVYSTMLIKCTQDITASMAAHNVILEKFIHFNSAPCANSNGERDFYWVMKKMIPGSSGTLMPGSMVTGDYILLEGSWKFGTVYDVSQIASVGFVQNKSTLEIYQTANSSANALIMPYNNDLQVMGIANIPAKTCNDKVTPIVNIRNNGKNTITSLSIKYKMNDGTLNTFTWNGSLTSLQKRSITLPELTFTILPQNILTVFTTSPNNVSDDYPKNDTLDFSFTQAPISTNQLKFILRTDNSPEETTWNVVGSTGTILTSGGPYTVPNQLQTIYVDVPDPDCYTFTIYDAGGNGICCTNGTGVYEISSGGTIFKQGGQFGYSESTEFDRVPMVGINEATGTPGFTIYPNPVTGSATISFSLPEKSDVNFQLLTTLGQAVNSKNMGTLNAGSHETTWDGSTIAPGVYILQLKTSSGVYSKKISIVK